MNAVEFTTELTAAPTLAIPAEAAARLPKSGRVRVLVLTDDEADEDRSADYAQFLRDDPADDAVYDGMR